MNKKFGVVVTGGWRTVRVLLSLPLLEPPLPLPVGVEIVDPEALRKYRFT